MTTTNEYLIFIHGVSDQNNQSHTPTYDQLYGGIDGVDKEFTHSDQWETAIRCDVEWGWNYDPPSANPGGHRLLAQAQENVAKMMTPLIDKASDFSLNPARGALSGARQLMIQGFSDMIYYASKDGRNSVRATVASQILEKIRDPLAEESPISLTFFGHSAGSVVSFDFLFYLFADDSLVSDRTFFDETNPEHKQFLVLRELAQSGRLRVRRLITFGSPISMLSFRNDAVLDILAKGEKLNPSDYGFDRNPEVFGEPLPGPRWINIWDKDDIIAWPVAPLMPESSMVTDMYIDVGDFISRAHNQYWDNKKVHRAIAKAW